MLEHFDVCDDVLGDDDEALQYLFDGVLGGVVLRDFDAGDFLKCRVELFE